MLSISSSHSFCYRVCPHCSPHTRLTHTSSFQPVMSDVFPRKNNYLSEIFMVIHFQLLSSCHPLSLSLAMHCGRWLLNVDFHSLRDFTSTSWIRKIHDPSFKKPVHLTLYIFKQLFVRQVERMSSGYFLYQEKQLNRKEVFPMMSVVIG